METATIEITASNEKKGPNNLIPLKKNNLKGAYIRIPFLKSYASIPRKMKKNTYCIQLKALVFLYELNIIPKISITLQRKKDR